VKRQLSPSEPPAAECLVALGANQTLGGRSLRESLDFAFASLADAGLDPVARSGLYRTPAYPPGAGPDFLNAAARIVTDLPPDQVLERLHRIEAALGRERHVRWAARTLDLDLLAMGDRVLPDRDTFRAWADMPPARRGTEAPDRLILPHPRLHERGFVLIPLAEVAPDWRHPVLGRTVAQMCAALPAEATSGIERVA